MSVTGRGHLTRWCRWILTSGQVLQGAGVNTPGTAAGLQYGWLLPGDVVVPPGTGRHES